MGLLPSPRGRPRGRRDGNPAGHWIAAPAGVARRRNPRPRRPAITPPARCLRAHRGFNRTARSHAASLWAAGSRGRKSSGVTAPLVAALIRSAALSGGWRAPVAQRLSCQGLHPICLAKAREVVADDLR